jgi:2-polyprenyl-3-methyl-5-hydroxy-6-metoxy-1,4-benzoquinol methylase
VDIIQDIKDHDKHYDIVISTEMLEHNKTRDLALKNMYKLADKMLIVTCANINRKEHGTTRTNPKDSPATTDYYKNISKEDIL